MTAPVVIIGTGLAGYNLAKEFRKLDAQTPLVMITSDDGRQYSKPLLSTGFGKQKSADDLAMADAGKMAEQLKMEIRTFQQVTGIDRHERKVLLGDDEIKYKDLVLAVGAEPIQIPIPGIEHLHTINDLMDYDRFHQIADKQKTVLVMGSGLVGCEYAHDMAVAGFNVILVAPDEAPLARLLPTECGNGLKKALAQLGVDVRMGDSVVSIEKQTEGLTATLASGETLDVHIGLSAVGLRARMDLAQSAGLATNRAIVVPEQVQTDAEHIYALGDCAEVSGHHLLYVLPLMNSARALAKTLSGEATAVKYPVMPVQVKTPSFPIVTVPPVDDAEGDWQIEGESPNFKAIFVGKSGKMLGYALTGECVAEKMALNKELPALLV